MKPIKSEIEAVEGSLSGEGKMKEIRLEIEALEKRIAPRQPPGLLGYEGHEGNQGGGNHHP